MGSGCCNVGGGDVGVGVVISLVVVLLVAVVGMVVEVPKVAARVYY
jgi:hypothetical protein